MVETLQIVKAAADTTDKKWEINPDTPCRKGVTE